MQQEELLIEPAFELKGSLFTLTILQLASCDIDVIQKQLGTLISRTPKFFQQAPLVICLTKLNNLSVSLDFTALMKSLKQLSLVPVGIRGGNPQQNFAATEAGLAIMPQGKDESLFSRKSKPAAPAKPQAKPEAAKPLYRPTKVIDKPVRSGQQVYAAGGDLVILSSVSHGAEILAEGNIHVYGKLRGRALAGVQGDNNARIFCAELDAELVSVAGQYLLKEDLQQQAIDKNAHVYLKDGRIQIAEIDS